MQKKAKKTGVDFFPKREFITLCTKTIIPGDFRKRS
jgi:hypothetical protein